VGEVACINPLVSYGICSWPAGLPEGVYEYVAGVQVPEDAPVPPNMVMRRLPACRYAVYQHRGLIADLGKRYSEVYENKLPQTGLQRLEPGFDLEVYTEEFTGDAPDSVIYIYIPVK
ncbi:MAG: GyrI-like domain-containing protein, partial [Anaerolineae bacterium]